MRTIVVMHGPDGDVKLPHFLLYSEERQEYYTEYISPLPGAKIPNCLITDPMDITLAVSAAHGIFNIEVDDVLILSLIESEDGTHSLSAIALVEIIGHIKVNNPGLF